MTRPSNRFHEAALRERKAHLLMRWFVVLAAALAVIGAPLVAKAQDAGRVSQGVMGEAQPTFQSN